MSYPDWEPAPCIPIGLLFDADGLFLGPVEAATHAIVAQGGFTDPWIEAERMLKAGGVSAERATAWLAENPGPINCPMCGWKGVVNVAHRCAGGVTGTLRDHAGEITVEYR